MAVVKHTVTLAVNSSGACTAYTGNIRGHVDAICYRPGNIDTGATVTVSGEDSAVAIITKASAGTSTVWWYPRAVANAVTNGAAGSTYDCPVPVFRERIKVVIASGGTSTAGAIDIYVDDDLP